MLKLKKAYLIVLRKLLNNDYISQYLLEKEFAAWQFFKNIVGSFLGNKKSHNYIQIITKFFTFTWTFSHKTWEQCAMNKENVLIKMKVERNYQ